MLFLSDPMGVVHTASADTVEVLYDQRWVFSFLPAASFSFTNLCLASSGLAWFARGKISV